MIYLTIVIRETNFGADYDTVVGVYDNLAASEERIARLKQKLGRYGYTYRTDVRALNEACGNF